MKRKNLYILCALALMGATSCLENNLPYPVIVPELTAHIEGCNEVIVDADARTITAVLPETMDIERVWVKKLEISRPDGITESECIPPMERTWNLREPKHFIIRNYDDYNWTLQATQSIEMFFSVEGQVGSTVIDQINKRVFVNVSKKYKLTKTKVKSMKLGPKDITSYSRSLNDTWNMDEPCTVDVTAHGRTETWTIYAELSMINVSIKKHDAWTRCAWVSADGLEGAENGFYYRQEGQEEWILVPQENITFNGASFTACIDGLEPLTSYECYAYCGTDTTEPVAFTTEDEKELPNGGFNVFSHAESNKYFSFFDTSHYLWNAQWWDSGNIGSTSVGESGVICAPDTDDKVEGEASARLNSRYIVVKFAAGNLFTGKFAELVGMEGGKVNFGRPWTSRPRKLVFSVKTINGPIDHVDGKVEGVKMGDPDISEVYVALGDWDYKKYGGTPDCPVQVNTTVASTTFNPHGENVIAYGKYSTEVSTDWHEVEIDLEYFDYFRTPTHIIISCAASKYGDYFTGCSTNTMWVDDMRFVY